MTASIINTDFIRKHPAQAVLTVLGLSGVALVFLPFTYDVVPVSVFLELPPPLPPFRGILNFGKIVWHVIPFVVLPFAISAGYLRWLLTGRSSRGEAGLGYTLALIAACVLVLVIFVDWLDWITYRHDPRDYVLSPTWREQVAWQSVIYPLIAFGAGAGLVMQNLRGRTPSVPNALVAMQVVYLPLAPYLIFVGLSFGPQIGCYVTIVPLLAYSAQIVMAAKRRWYSLTFVVAFGLLSAAMLGATWLGY